MRCSRIPNKKIFIFKCDEPVGGFDINQLKDELAIISKKLKFDFIVLPHSIMPVTKDDLKELLK